MNKPPEKAFISTESLSFSIQLKHAFRYELHTYRLNFGKYFEPLHYSSKLCCFIYYLCMNLWKITSKYSLQPRVEYLDFGPILWLFAELKRISSNFLCVWLFVGQSRIIISLWCNADLFTWITRIIFPVITWKWPKFDFQYSTFALKMAKFEIQYSIFASIFPSRSYTSSSNHPFFASPTIQLRY